MKTQVVSAPEAVFRRAKLRHAVSLWGRMCVVAIRHTSSTEFAGIARPLKDLNNAGRNRASSPGRNATHATVKTIRLHGEHKSRANWNTPHQQKLGAASQIQANAENQFTNV